MSMVLERQGRAFGLRRVALSVVPSVLLAAVVFIVVLRVLVEPPLYDESEVLHGSWRIAHGDRLWIDFLEHHSPLFNTINARIFDTDSAFFILQAKLFALLTYLTGTYLFALACRLWLNVAPAHRLSFMLYAQLMYICLTWPVLIGVVRPENYSMLALMSGAICAWYVGRTPTPLSSALAFASGLLLASSFSFSPRSVFLIAGVALAVLPRLPTIRDWVRVGAAACLGGVVVIWLNVLVAPASEFYLWMVQFNTHILPYRQTAWQSSYGSILVAILSIIVTLCCLTVLLTLRFFKTSQKPFAGAIAAAVLTFADRRLFFGQLVILLCWIYLRADHLWGQQSFGGIAVASSYYITAFIALTFEADAKLRQKLGIDSGLSDLIKSKWDRDRSFARVAGGVAIVAAVCFGALAYFAAKKTYVMLARLQPAGMLQDLSLVLNERHYRLASKDDLLPLSESRNLAEWLLWSKRECELFRNDHVMVIPTRHPICVNDASFYFYAGEHFRAMADAHSDFMPRPPYAVVEDILRNKPALIDGDYNDGPLGPKELERPDVEKMLRTEYAVINSPRLGNWAWLRRDVPIAQDGNLRQKNGRAGPQTITLGEQ